MRDIEKGILLSELINPNNTTKEQISAFINWIKEQDCYITLQKRISELKKTSSKISTIIKYEFVSLHLEKANSIEECMIIYSKILYLSQICTPSFYVNPLFVLNENEKNIKIGDIIIKKDNKNMTLQEFCNSKDYSFNEKIELINKIVSSYEDDTYQKLFIKIQDLKEKPRNLPERKVFSLKFILVGITYLIFISFFIFLKITNNKILTNALGMNFSTFSSVEYFCLLSLSFTILSTIFYVIELIIRSIKFHKYHKIRTLIFNKNKLQDEIHDESEHLKKYIIKNMEKQNKLSLTCNNFSKLSKYYEGFLYLSYINNHVKKFKHDHLSKINLILYLLCTIFIIIFIILISTLGGKF